MLAETTHATLLARLRDGHDAGAWREFHDRYSELIRGFLRRRGAQPADIDDVLQEVLLALSKSLPEFAYDPAKGKFRSYLKAATIRSFFRRIGQKPAEQRLDQIEEATRAACEDDEIEGAWEAEWRQHHLRLAMRTIAVEFSEADRRAFQRYAVEGEGAQETGAALGMSVEQVYQAKSRIVRRLTELVEQQVREEG